MEKHTSMGMNRTGADMSPIHSKAMAKGSLELTDQQPAGSKLRQAIEQQYLGEANQVGSVPLPGELKGVLKSLADKATGRNPEVFINKAGQRLAFERTGVRLYDAVIRKCNWLSNNGEQLPFSIDELLHLRNEELAHFHLLAKCLRDIGADPTAMTPDADVSGVAAMGYQRALNDPRTTVAQCLDLLLELELADNAAWEMLVELAESMGMNEVANDFRRAKREEDEHERKVRSWCRAALEAEAGRTRKQQH